MVIVRVNEFGWGGRVLCSSTYNVVAYVASVSTQRCQESWNKSEKEGWSGGRGRGGRRERVREKQILAQKNHYSAKRPSIIHV